MANPVKKQETSSLVFSFIDVPFDGLDIKAAENFGNLYAATETKAATDQELEQTFQKPVNIEAHVLPVASKLEVKGRWNTELSGLCDRCACGVQMPISGDFYNFLMPQSQFSEHDKPGGKVIHGPTRNPKPSRHHSRTKAPVLSDAEGEHEDVSFGAFDGKTVDLRGLIREQLILQIPMKYLCGSDCKGLCLVCGESVNEKKCVCAEGPTLVQEETPEALSQLGAAFKGSGKA